MKFLLIGAGTLGCTVSRILISCGARDITFIDGGRVSYSNPVRQSLYTFEDCSLEKNHKATLASRFLLKILPTMQTAGYVLHVPMPDHPLHSEKEVYQSKQDVDTLASLIEASDVTFVLTDSRESRWLPIALCAARKRVLINIALGADEYLVQLGDNAESSGCYFCSDVVAPENSLKRRSLDQQCTVTRPGLAYIASSVAVDILGSFFRCGNSASVPRQIRGNISSYLVSKSDLVRFPYCSCCSSRVIDALTSEGFEFVHKVCNVRGHLEAVSGLDAYQASLPDIDFDLDWE